MSASAVHLPSQRPVRVRVLRGGGGGESEELVLALLPDSLPVRPRGLAVRGQDVMVETELLELDEAGALPMNTTDTPSPRRRGGILSPFRRSKSKALSSPRTNSSTSTTSTTTATATTSLEQSTLAFSLADAEAVEWLRTTFPPPPECVTTTCEHVDVLVNGEVVDRKGPLLASPPGTFTLTLISFPALSSPEVTFVPVIRVTDVLGNRCVGQAVTSTEDAARRWGVDVKDAMGMAVVGFLMVLAALNVMSWWRSKDATNHTEAPPPTTTVHVKVAPIPSHLGRSRLWRSAVTVEPEAKSQDLSITLEERELLAQLRARLAAHQGVTEEEEGGLDGVLRDWNIPKATYDALHEDAVRAIQTKYVNTDFRLVRFLRARQYDLAKAEKMARHSLTWRARVRPDWLVDEQTPPRWLVDYFGSPLFSQCTFEGPSTEDPVTARIERFWLRDREGQLCMFVRSGPLDWRYMYKRMNYDLMGMVRWGVWALEVMRRDSDRVHSNSNGATPSYMTAIVDLAGFSPWHQLPVYQLVPLARKFFGILAGNYPELLKRVVVVRAPVPFWVIWNLISPFIPAEVRDKIKFHTGYSIKYIEPYVDMDNTPAYLGGHLTGNLGDPKYCEDRLPPRGPFV